MSGYGSGQYGRMQFGGGQTGAQQAAEADLDGNSSVFINPALVLLLPQFSPSPPPQLPVPLPALRPIHRVELPSKYEINRRPPPLTNVRGTKPVS